MKKQLLIALFLFITYNSYSQINFENGYFINNKDEKINCLIKNIDWASNPSSFSYKLSESSEAETISLEHIKEFEIANKLKYRRFNVTIDRSSENVNEIDYKKEPVFTKENLFLKVLVEGKATLYTYKSGNLTKYFYTIDSSAIELLVYKLYKSEGQSNYFTSETGILKNERYKQQLWLALKCPTITMKEVSLIDYKIDALMKLFLKYNSYNNSTSVNYETKQKRDLFNLNIRPGIASTSLSLTNVVSSPGIIAFNNEIGARLGLEFEFILPFNNNKWAILVEPTYRNYQAKKLINSDEIKVDYKSIEFPFGLRHYFFLNKKSKIFINAQYVFSWSMNSKIYFDNVERLDIKAGNNLALGLGYKYNRYSLEMRYDSKRNILGNYAFWNSDYKTLSVIFGYTLF